MRFILPLTAARGDSDKIFEVGEAGGQPYIAMEFIEGQSLQRGASSFGLLDKIQLIQQTAEVPHTASRAGHHSPRDIKAGEHYGGCGGRDGVLSAAGADDFGLARDVNACRAYRLGRCWHAPGTCRQSRRGEIRTMDLANRYSQPGRDAVRACRAAAVSLFATVDAPIDTASRLRR